MNRKRINWKFTLFFILNPIAAVIGTTLLAMSGLIQVKTLILAFVFMILTGLSITAGYHRCFSHKAYNIHPIVKWFFVLFGSAAFEGGVLEWCTDHRNHHRYTDTPRDPYNIKQGFWHAHIGWIFTLHEDQRDYSNVEDLSNDPLLQAQKKYFVWFAIIMGYLLPMGIASLWHDPLGGLFIAGALRMTLNHHFTFFINSVCHYFGKQTYSDQTARDNALMAIFTYGEGYHNFHHKFPLDYRNGIRFYDFDPTKWFIKGLFYCGLASNLKQVSDSKILQYKLRQEEKKLRESIEKQSKEDQQHMGQLLEPLRDAVLHSLKSLEKIEQAFAEFQLQHPALRLSSEEAARKLVEYKFRLAQAKNDLKQSVSAWKNLISYSSQISATT